MPRALLVALAFVALVYAALSVTPSELAAKPREATVLFLPMLSTSHPTADIRKGVAGFTFAPTVTSTRSYQAMNISASYNWQSMLTPTWNTSQAYPLPQQPYNDFRSLSDRVWFGMFQLGFTCDNSSQTALAACAGNVVRGQGAIYVLVFNEPDNNDVNAGDALTPTLAAMDFKVVRDTLWAANPQVKIVFGNFLWPNANYFNAVKSEFQRLYHEDIRNSIAVYGWHDYSNVGGICPSPAHYPEDATCVSQAFANVLYNITNTVKAIDPSKPVWVTEWGISGGAETNINDYAQMLPMMCAQLRAEAKIEKFFIFIGLSYPSIPNASLLNVDGSESVLGKAYEAC